MAQIGMARAHVCFAYPTFLPSCADAGTAGGEVEVIDIDASSSEDGGSGGGGSGGPL